MTKAIIYKPTKVATQSGLCVERFWILEFLPKNTRFKEPLMGWDANSDMEQSQVRLKFSIKDDAVTYAKTIEGLEYDVLKHNDRKQIIKHYVNNFR